MLRIAPTPFTGKPLVIKTGEKSAKMTGILAATGLGCEVEVEPGKSLVITIETEPGVWRKLKSPTFEIRQGPPICDIPAGWDPAIPLGLYIPGPKSAWVGGELDLMVPPWRIEDGEGSTE